jgi:hypothetical protein
MCLFRTSKLFLRNARVLSASGPAYSFEEPNERAHRVVNAFPLRGYASLSQAMFTLVDAMTWTRHGTFVLVRNVVWRNCRCIAGRSFQQL